MNLPNLLTISRFLLIPAFLLVVFYRPASSLGLLWGMFIFVLAGITDLLDGYIARRYKMITNWGKLMDPLADKSMLMTVLVSLWILELIPLFVVVVVIVKEVLLILGAAFLYKSKKVVVQANYFGKVASLVFFLAVVAVIFDLPYYEGILIAAVVVTLVALIQYFYITLLKSHSD